MHITTTRDGGIPVLKLEGRLDAQGAIELEDALKSGISETDRAVVMDMARVGYLSSAGIRIIIATEKRLKGRKGGLYLSRVQQYPLSVLEMTGFSSLLSIHPTCEEAMRAAREVCAHSETSRMRDSVSFSIDGAEYTVTPAGSDAKELVITGHPSPGFQQGEGDDLAIPVSVGTDAWSLGRGAPGLQQVDPAYMGDLLALGHTAVWLMPGAGGTLDYLVLDKKAMNIPLVASFLISSAGPDACHIRVVAASDEGITFTALHEALSSIASRLDPAYCGVLSYSFSAEAAGVSTLFPSTGGPDTGCEDDRSGAGRDSGGATLAGCAVAVDPAVGQSRFGGLATDLLVHHPASHPGTLPRILSLVFPGFPFNSEVQPEEAASDGLASGSPASLRHLSPKTRIRRATIHLSVISDIRLNTGVAVFIEGDIREWNQDYEKIVHMMHHDCSEVHLHPISGGYSGSLVFRDDAYDRSGRREMPFVLKLDKWKNIKPEIEGYEGHVKRYIQNNATQIIQQGQSGEYGGILYSFVGIGGPGSRISSLEEYYLTHTTDEVCAVFDMLFRKVLRAWYGQPRLRDLPLYRIYADIFNYDAVRSWAQARYGISPDDEFIDLPFGAGRSRNPLYFMESVLPQRLSQNWNVYEGSVHGDLNMKNVLMDDGMNMWLIDFAMTGHSHILRDIAKLEAVLKFEMIPITSEERLITLISLEKAFLHPEKTGEIPEIPGGITDPDIIKAFTVIRQLRRYADTITLLDDDIRQYYLALLYYTLSVPAYVSVDDFRREYAWISSSYLCNRLK